MINIRLDYVLLDKRMKLKDLSQATGLAANNLSILKTNKARAIRFSRMRNLNFIPGVRRRFGGLHRDWLF